MIGASTGGQCSNRNVFWMCAPLFAHVAVHTIARGKVGKTVCSLIMAISFVLCIVVFNIDRLTMMHQLVGQMALEAAGRYANDWIMVVVQKSSEVVMIVFLILPNLLAGLDEHLLHVNSNGSLTFHGSGRFASTPFYRKQHAFLHYVLAIQLMVACTTLWPPWRYSRKMQLMRSFFDPACIISIAMILWTHTHIGMGSGHQAHANHLDTHPVIGALMILASLTQLCASILHLSHGADLTEKGSSIPSLKMSRLINSFAHLLACNFLFIDTFMEYLGCRHDALLNRSESTRLGLTLESEVSTYQACTLMLSAFMFGLFMLTQPDEKQEQPYYGVNTEIDLAKLEAVKVGAESDREG